MFVCLFARLLECLMVVCGLGNLVVGWPFADVFDCVPVCLLFCAFACLFVLRVRA